MNSLPRFTVAVLLFVGVPLIHAQVEADSFLPDAHLTFTTIDVPGAAITNVHGINSVGDVAGNYSTATNTPSRGFSFSNGNFTLYDYPGGNDTVPVGINDSGVISGSAFIRNYSGIVSFLYDRGTFTTIRAPGKTVTLANGINNAGVIVGGYGSLATTDGFVRIGTYFKTISPPGNYVNVFGNGINNLRQIVGTGDDTGFFWSQGQFKTIAVPGANKTVPNGINDNGIIVGWYEKGPPYAFHGFALKNGKYVSINYPGAIATFAVGINASGQIVGSYELDDMTYHGFVTSPIYAADLESRSYCHGRN